MLYSALITLSNSLFLYIDSVQMHTFRPRTSTPTKILLHKRFNLTVRYRLYTQFQITNFPFPPSINFSSVSILYSDTAYIHTVSPQTFTPTNDPHSPPRVHIPPVRSRQQFTFPPKVLLCRLTSRSKQFMSFTNQLDRPLTPRTLRTRLARRS